MQDCDYVNLNNESTKILFLVDHLRVMILCTLMGCKITSTNGAQSDGDPDFRNDVVRRISILFDCDESSELRF